jgi:tetratricopeptide (TPR) repeat protein
LATVLLATTCWGSDELRRYAPIEKALTDTQRHAVPSREVLPADYRADLDRLAEAERDYPDDAEAHYRMSQLWLGLYQARTLDELRAAKVPASDEVLWGQTSPLDFHGRVWVYSRMGQTAAMEWLRSDPIVKHNLRPALQQALLANQACPALAGAHLLVAELAAVATSPAEDRPWIAAARRLAPASPDVLLCCGTLDVQAGRVDSGCADWRRALELDSKLCDKVLPLALQFLGPDGMIEKVLPQSPQWLVELAQERYRSPRQADLRRKIARRAGELLDRASLAEAETAYWWGAIAALEDEYPRAIESYRRAVKLRGMASAWRYELALLLLQQGMADEAREQAQICAQLEPSNGDYRALVARVEQARLAAHTD